MNTETVKTVADYVTENIKNAHLFKKHGIDFCCGGGVSLAQAAEKANVSLEILEKELQQTEMVSSPGYDYKNWKLDFLTDHIINVHHHYVEENIPLLIQYSARVAKVHGRQRPELIKIQQLFTKVAQELSAHLRKEELILFPFIKKLVKAQEEATPVAQPQFGKIDNPIKMMETEHDEAGAIFKEIADLSDNYTCPEWACNTYKALYSKLEEFENDLHHHVHLENNILFPKAIQLERSLTN
ncbi:regulator of cell morphogenesis and NO signaling [Salegentibacter sp. 24]|jgi:regulator of cell morphogenesis and NO signaling|uniref:iron-sulfur cluster repair di-iron protein n=1 Tax=Salegentibacter sp. 24 TaxID=2183986 RepID=UPI00105B3E17|nr:iron-sulfur cluster repair di-iron protein [Salegentibacter sp. 24]TDN83850.1 regulator of cell morphogenesis and NO signaling [Salegentibacter sp. 24]